jgi:hypothetical protein
MASIQKTAVHEARKQPLIPREHSEEPQRGQLLESGLN